MSTQGPLENNVFKVAEFLGGLTREVLAFFYPGFNLNLPPGSLLFGEYLRDSWDRYYYGKVKEAYGIYFIFLRDKDLRIPLYVGKGRLPSRCLSHFSRTQYIDMLLSGHFGGVPRNPKLVENDSRRQEKIKKALADFEVAFLLSESSKAKELEWKFIKSLVPLGNNEVYRKITKTPPYRIEELIPLWEVAKHLFLESSHDTLPDLEELKECHEEILERFPKASSQP